MNFLIYAVIGLVLLAFVVTIFALATAPDGYEDEQGFHADASDPSQAHDPGPLGTKKGPSDPAIHPLLQVH